MVARRQWCSRPELEAWSQPTHCSLSMSISFSSKSLMRSWLAASNMKVTESPWSSACADAEFHDTCQQREESCAQ